MKDYHINIFHSDDDGGYIADIPDLEACSAFGATPEDALRYNKGKIIKCKVNIKDIVVYPYDISKARCRKVKVLKGA